MILFLPPETTGKTESTPATARSFYSLDFFGLIHERPGSITPFSPKTYFHSPTSSYSWARVDKVAISQ